MVVFNFFHIGNYWLANAGLDDFNYKLAMALINSSADPYFQNMLIANPNRAAAEAQNDVILDTRLGIARDPATLAQCIQGEKWLKKHCYMDSPTGKI